MVNVTAHDRHINECSLFVNNSPVANIDFCKSADLRHTRRICAMLVGSVRRVRHMSLLANPGIWTESDRFARKTVTFYRVIVLHAEQSLASGLSDRFACTPVIFTE